MTRIRHLVFLQAGADIVDLELVHDSEDQQASVGFSNDPYLPQVVGAQDLVSEYRSTYTPSLPLPFRCSCGLCGGLKVPQRLYVPIQMSPDQRNGETFTFSKGGCGIRLIDAAQNRLSGLVGGDDLMFVDVSVSTFSLRIEVSNRFDLHVGSLGNYHGIVAWIPLVDEKGS